MPETALPAPSIAVIIPCHNEESTVARVVAEFREALPEARIHVCDNNSTDQTAQEAARAGAAVHSEERKGKGRAVRRMFADVEADVYVLVDGDATYHAPSVREMVRQLVDNDLDMVVGCRVAEEQEAYRCGHRFGNRLLTGSVAAIFGGSSTDMLSGYRVFSRRFVKSFPIFSLGFEIETELTVHSLQLRLPCREMSTPYKARPEGSFSKLQTYRDGFRILRIILKLLLLERPTLTFGSLATACFLLAAILAVPLLVTWLQTGLVPRFPTAILCTGTVLMGAGALAMGYIMAGIRRARLEAKYLTYLSIPAPGRGNWRETA